MCRGRGRPGSLGSGFAPEAEDRFFVGGGLELYGREPADGVRFIAHLRGEVALGDDQEANVVMFVGVFDEVSRSVVASGDDVNVEVERRRVVARGGVAELREAGLFGRFAHRDVGGVGLAVGVAAWLEPAIELAMVDEQKTIAGRGGDPGRGGDVARAAGAIKTVGVGDDELADAVGHRRLAGMAGVVAIE